MSIISDKLREVASARRAVEYHAREGKTAAEKAVTLESEMAQALSVLLPGEVATDWSGTGWHVPEAGGKPVLVKVIDFREIERRIAASQPEDAEPELTHEEQADAVFEHAG